MPDSPVRTTSLKGAESALSKCSAIASALLTNCIYQQLTTVRTGAGDLEQEQQNEAGQETDESFVIVVGHASVQEEAVMVKA